jgi:hypothetical protein
LEVGQDPKHVDWEQWWCQLWVTHVGLILCSSSFFLLSLHFPQSPSFPD